MWAIPQLLLLLSDLWNCNLEILGLSGRSDWKHPLCLKKKNATGLKACHSPKQKLSRWPSLYLASDDCQVNDRNTALILQSNLPGMCTSMSLISFLPQHFTAWCNVVFQPKQSQVQLFWWMIFFFFCWSSLHWHPHCFDRGASFKWIGRDSDRKQPCVKTTQGAVLLGASWWNNDIRSRKSSWSNKLKAYKTPKHGLMVCNTHTQDFTTLESYHGGNYFIFWQSQG